MKKYRVNVNGTNYEVEIELISENDIVAAPPAPAPRPVAEPIAEPEMPAAAPPAAMTGTAEKVLAPMPGTILSINVKPGETIKKGQVLLILEAMKMENEIMASRSGTIVSVDVMPGAVVESGTLLCSIA